MTITCPQCDASLTLKGLKAGTYTPKCPKCSKPFMLVLAEEEDGTLAIEQLEATQPEAKQLPKTIAVPMLKRKPAQEDDSDESPDTDDEVEEETPANTPLPKTKPYPMIRRKPVEEEGDITDVEDEGETPQKPGTKPLPKTQSYPMIKRKPPQNEDE